MFNGRNVCKRVVAMVLVFIFAFTNCFTLLTTVSLATAEELGKQPSDNFSKNVEYVVNFEKDGEDNGYEVEGSIDEEDLSIHSQVAVKNEGYLKSAKILIESENGLSFDINAENADDYQVDGNQIILNNIAAGEKTDINIPITYKEREDINNLNKKINVKLIGIYVNKNGSEKSISENYVLRLKWNTNTEFSITSNVRKYIPYASNENKGLILQTSVESWIPSENNFVEREELNIEAVKIEGYKIEKITIANKLGENLEESSWNYDETENNINIKLDNNSEKINSQELLITYILSGEKELELPFTLNSKINGSIYMFGTEEKAEAELEAKYEVEQTIGKVVTVEGASSESIKLGNLLNNAISEENQYKTTYETKITADISSIDMVEGIIIRNENVEFENDEATYETNSTYKKVGISKENFDYILGENGKIEILNKENELISTINKNTQIENNEYQIEINSENVVVKTSKPQVEGVLSISLTAEMTNSNYSYEQLKTFDFLNAKYTGSVLYEENVENKVSDIVNKISLEKPQTNSQLTISRDTLTTIADNNNIEIEIKLNNTTEDVDLYKNPKFEIIFPEYVEDVNVSNIAIANSENVFEFEDSRIYKNSEGKIVLNIDVKGEQTKYNTNTFSNGTSILVNAKMKVNLYTPSIKQNIVLNYTNENATTYKEEQDGKGHSEVEISYKAPVGVVSINKISNYEETGKTVTSVEQGKVTDKIEIFDNPKIATMDIIVMNNNENSCDGVKILGRIPFKGNKDVTTGEDLGTTIDTKLVSNIIGDELNKASAIVYYSNNGEATEDLELPENGWTTDVEDFSQVKSYLILVNDYEMNPGEILKYSYRYQIPGNLEHNTDIYGSFKTIYNDKTAQGTVKEVSNADIVGLTTGVGPQLSVETISNVQDRAREYEKIKYTVRIENTGSEVSENVVVKTKIPTGATYAVHSNVLTLESVEGWELKSDREIITTIDKLNPGDIKKVEFFVQVNKLPSIEEYYADKEGFTKNANGTYEIQEAYEDENGNTKYSKKAINGLPEIKIICESTITAKDLAKEMKSEDKGIIVEKANLVAEEIVATQDNIAKVNETIESKIQVKNNSQETMKNIVVTKKLPEGLKYADSYIRGYEDDGITLRKIKSTDYDASTRIVTWKIDELQPGRTAIVIGEWVVGEMADKVYKDTISTTTNIEVNGERYQAGQVDIAIGRPHLEVSQVSNKTNQYIKVGDMIEYTFTIKNVGSVSAEDVTLTDKLPDEVAIKKLTYNVDGVEVSKVVSKNEDAVVYTNILPDGRLDATVTAQIKDIPSSQKVITNVANVEATDIANVKSNEVTNTVERTADSVSATGESTKQITSIKSKSSNTSNSSNEESSKDENVKSKYEIKGTVWLDENKNGSRDKGEKTLSGITAKLMNQATGEKVAEEITNADGQYKFNNLDNGSYMVIFSYDNTKYSIAEYKKQNVSEDMNSDVITANDSGRVVAATDSITIKDGSKSNIDAGFIEATTFDLALTKRISKVTVQSNNETKTYDFNNTDLAKVDINAKYINGAKVIVEYAITVKNEGDIEGYAKEIVDYLPSELEFSTDLNSKWYKGNDGNLYTEELANTAIPAGQSKTVKLVLTKTMTENYTGIINNEAEISKDYNKAGIKDADSDVKDRDQKDDDMSSADLIIGIKTGDTLIYVSAIIAAIIATIVVAFVIKKSKIKYKLLLKFGKEV